MKNEYEQYGFVRVAAGVPNVFVGHPEDNVREMVAMAKDAAGQGVKLLWFPELGITGYTCGEAFKQEHLLDKAANGLCRFAEETKHLDLLSFVGCPWPMDDQLFNMAFGINKGRILGAQPKWYLAEGGIFYENRWFAPGERLVSTETRIGKHFIQLGRNLLYVAKDNPKYVATSEICQDGWEGLRPSAFHAVNGATLIGNLSSSPAGIGKAEFRRDMCKMHSALSYCAYLYTSSSACTKEGDSGECTTDFVNDGDVFICENGSVKAQGDSERFQTGPQLVMADIDVEFLVRERRTNPSFGQQVREFHQAYRRLEVEV